MKLVGETTTALETHPEDLLMPLMKWWDFSPLGMCRGGRTKSPGSLVEDGETSSHTAGSSREPSSLVIEHREGLRSLRKGLWK